MSPKPRSMPSGTTLPGERTESNRQSDRLDRNCALSVPCSDLPALLSNVDIAMYQSKDLGRNRYTLLTSLPSHCAAPTSASTGQEAARRAGRRPADAVFPAGCTAQGLKPVHHEILVRIRDGNGNFILPAHFIELAESLGLVQEIDMRVIEKLLQLWPKTARAGKNCATSSICPVSIPTSTGSSGSSGCCAQAASIQPAGVRDHGNGGDGGNRRYADLHPQTQDVGCRLALDDFGGGFSSFYTLSAWKSIT